MHKLEVWHVVALAVAAAAYLALFIMTGDSDLVFVIGACVFVVIAMWLFPLPKFLDGKR
jgi:hypothetical protein